MASTAVSQGVEDKLQDDCESARCPDQIHSCEQSLFVRIFKLREREIQLKLHSVHGRRLSKELYQASGWERCSCKDFAEVARCRDNKVMTTRNSHVKSFSNCQIDHGTLGSMVPKLLFAEWFKKSVVLGFIPVICR